jgi:membrane protein YqaA with SNARE-associated domain
VNPQGFFFGYKSKNNMNEIYGLFISAFVSSTIAPGGSEAVLAYLVSQQLYPLQELLIVATVGNTLGAMTTWFLGYLASQKFPAATLLPENKQKALDFVKTRGQWVLLLTWLPVVGDVLCFAAGWLKQPLLSGMLLILLGKMGRYAVIAWLFV